MFYGSFLTVNKQCTTLLILFSILTPACPYFVVRARVYSRSRLARGSQEGKGVRLCRHSKAPLFYFFGFEDGVDPITGKGDCTQPKGKKHKGGWFVDLSLSLYRVIPAGLYS